MCGGAKGWLAYSPITTLSEVGAARCPVWGWVAPPHHLMASSVAWSFRSVVCGRGGQHYGVATRVCGGIVRQQSLEIPHDGRITWLFALPIGKTRCLLFSLLSLSPTHTHTHTHISPVWVCWCGVVWCWGRFWSMIVFVGFGVWFYCSPDLDGAPLGPWVCAYPSATLQKSSCVVLSRTIRPSCSRKSLRRPHRRPRVVCNPCPVLPLPTVCCVLRVRVWCVCGLGCCFPHALCYQR